MLKMTTGVFKSLLLCCALTRFLRKPIKSYLKELNLEMLVRRGVST